MKPVSLGGVLKPSPTAAPSDPFPTLIALRLTLVVAYWVYVWVGGMGEFRPLVAVSGGYMTVSMLATTVALMRARHDPMRLVETWAWVIPADLVVQAVANLPIYAEFSPIPLLAIVTITKASTIFSPRTSVAAGAMAAALVVVTAAIHSMAGVHPNVLSMTFTAGLLVAVAAFAAERAGAESATRQRMERAEARERDQNATLRRALEAARVSEARFEAFSNHAPVVLLLFDDRGQPTFASTRLERDLGFKVSHLLSPAFRERSLDPGDLRAVHAAIRAALDGTPTGVELKIDSAKGERKRFSGVFFPVDNGAGAIIRDVTEERMLSAQLMRAQQMETVGTLAGGIAHDFNNLLTAILGNLYLAAREVPEQSEAQAYIHDAQVAGERGADLVRRLLAYSRPGIDDVAPVSVARLVEETAQLARRGLTPQIDLRIEPINPAATVMGNFGELQQVLMNLMINARDAMPNGGRLTLACVSVEIAARRPRTRVDLEPGPYHMLIVADTGTGMSPETISRVFDPFFTTKEVGRGTGLGLSTALGIVRGHGGTLDVESNEGVGSTFRLLLPVASPEPDIAPATAEAAA